MDHFIKNGLISKDGAFPTVPLKTTSAPTDASKTNSASTSSYSINDKLKAPVSKRILKAPLLSGKTLSNLKRKADGKNTNKIIPSKRSRFYNAYRRQSFSLPDSIMFYITKNPLSPEFYQKLIQCCKYFFTKNPMFVVSHLFFICKKDNWNISLNGKKYDFKHLTNKIWITNRLAIDIKNSTERNSFSLIIPKIHSTHIRKFTLYNQNIFFNDFVTLASKCEHIWFSDATVMNKDGTVAVMEKVIEMLPNIENYHDSNVFNKITTGSFKNLLVIPHFCNICDLSLRNIPEVFDIDSFYAYMKANNKTQIRLSFNDQLSAAYISRLQTIVNKIVQSQNHDYLVPYISFTGMIYVYAVALRTLYDKNLK